METRDRRDAARLEIGQARRIQAGLPNFSGTVPEFSQFKVSYRVDSCIKPWGRPGHKRRLAYLTPTIDKVRVLRYGRTTRIRGPDRSPLLPILMPSA